MVQFTRDYLTWTAWKAARPGAYDAYCTRSVEGKRPRYSNYKLRKGTYRVNVYDARMRGASAAFLDDAEEGERDKNPLWQFWDWWYIEQPFRGHSCRLIRPGNNTVHTHAFYYFEDAFILSSRWSEYAGPVKQK